MNVTRLVFIMVAIFALFVGFSATGCSCGGDDDDDDNDAADDDFGDDDTGDDDTGDDDTADDDTADDDADDDADVFDIDFEDYVNGPLGAPWVVEGAGTSTVAIETLAKAGAGKVLTQEGGNAEESQDYVLAQYAFTDTSADLWVSFEAYTASSDVDFGFRVMQNFMGYALTEAQLVVEDSALKAWDPVAGDFTACGTVTGATWTQIAILIHFAAGTFDVEIGGAPSTCTGIDMIYGDGSPLAFLQVIDWSDTGLGGEFWVDNLSGDTDSDATNVFEDDFETYSVGALVAPWSIAAQGGDSTAEIATLTDDGSGKALKIDGGVVTVEPDWIGSTYQFTDTSANLWVNFDAQIAANDAEFGFSVMQNYYSYAYTEVQLVVEAEVLKAYDETAGDYVDCGAFTAGTWHNVGIALDWAGTFGVQIDGAPGTCAGLGMIWGDGYPFAFIQVIDYSDLDFGGTAQFDNFLGSLAAP